MNSIYQDPRYQQSKKQILDLIEEKRSQITEVKPPNPKLEAKTRQYLDEFEQMRGGSLFFPFIGTGLGNGPLVQLIDESVKYDFITGIGVHCFGHSHLDIISSSLDASITDVVMEGHLQQNFDAVDLTKLLIKVSGMDHCFLSSTGAMANENAFKICMQKRGGANRILAFDRCFMGRTITMSQVTDKPQFREGLPVNQPVDYIPFYDEEHPEESTEKALHALKAALERYPGQHCAMSFELVQGEGGFIVGHTEFFKALMNILREHDIPVIADEVQTFGRTSQLFAYQHFGLDDYIDVVTIGKLSQACATLYKAHLRPKPGLLSQTFTTSATAIRASKLIIEAMIEDGHFGPDGKNLALHHHFVQRLEEIRSRHPELISGPYGIGGMVAFVPLGGHLERVVHFVKQLFEAGVMSFFAGRHPYKCRFLLPLLAIDDQDIDRAVKIIEQTLLKCHESDSSHTH